MFNKDTQLFSPFKFIEHWKMFYTSVKRDQNVEGCRRSLLELKETNIKTYVNNMSLMFYLNYLAKTSNVLRENFDN